MSALAIINAEGYVVTFVRSDVPDGWVPPDGCAVIPETDLPAGWQRVPERHGMAELRAERDARLAACDWTQLPDSPCDRAAWAIYRQELRDLPSVYSGDGPIQWPSCP